MKATRQAFGEALARLGEQHKNIVVLDADLSKSTKSELFAKKFKDRFFEMGISESNMIGAAAGLALTGKIPFACSFGCFLTGRYDVIRLSVAYAQAPVRLIGTHAGVGIGDDGHSQMGLEDISLMRSLPTMGVFQPMDATETELLIEWLVTTWKGPAYVRLTRQNLPNFYPQGKAFDPLKLLLVKAPPVSKPARSIFCVASGAGVNEAVMAAEELATHGVAMTVWNALALKPFDEATVRSEVAKLSADKDLVVTVEDHSVIGGLGSCVSTVLAGLHSHPKQVSFGVQDVFGESGEPAELYDKFGISAKSIVHSLL